MESGNINPENGTTQADLLSKHIIDVVSWLSPKTAITNDVVPILTLLRLSSASFSPMVDFHGGEAFKW